MSVKQLLKKTIQVDGKNKEQLKFSLKTFDYIYSQYGDNEALLIAKVMLKLWSSKLYFWAERVIHEYAIMQDIYFKRHQLEDVHAFDDDKAAADCYSMVLDNENYSSELYADYWISKYEIIYLIWDKFNMKEHFEQTKSHRFWIRQSYERLKRYLSAPTKEEEEEEIFFIQMEELIEKHDLSKYAFSQAIGYTLNWVHNNRYEKVWVAARNHHYSNEPHHIEYWNIDPNDKWRVKKYSILFEKKNKNDDMSLPYLYESFIDMVAREWEKKKGKDLNISDANLVYMDEKYFSKYNANEKKILKAFINKIK